jgi:hypothetical protein
MTQVTFMANANNKTKFKNPKAKMYQKNSHQSNKLLTKTILIKL